MRGNTMGDSLAPIAFNLDPPGTFVFTGPQSTRGYRLNKFALSLKRPENRAAFLADETAYAATYGLGDEEAALVRARDWTGLLQAGGHLQAILKLAATTGQGLWHIGGHNSGVSVEALIAACPRRVAHEWEGR
jgi:protocatechuate 4,5-dioxygenase alpha chain